MSIRRLRPEFSFLFRYHMCRVWYRSRDQAVEMNLDIGVFANGFDPREIKVLLLQNHLNVLKIRPNLLEKLENISPGYVIGSRAE